MLDANVFIEAKNRYYAFNLCPGFWNALIAEHQSKRVFSIDRVRDELANEGDRLGDWAKKSVRDSFFESTQELRVIDAFRQIVSWVNAQGQFTPAPKDQFASVADGWLVAFAEVHGLIVVTHEEYASDVKRKVPIPNICLELEVKYVNTFEMLEDLKVKFILSTKR